VDIGVPDGSQGAMFSPVPIDLTQYPPEAVACNLKKNKMLYLIHWNIEYFSNIAVKTLVKTRVSGKVEPKAELPQIAEATVDLEKSITYVLQYVEDVLADKVAPDNSIGRNLLKLVQAVPKMSREDLDNMMSANIKDLLMGMYLSQLTRVQTQLNEKLLMTSPNVINQNNI
jgi:translation initiation factor 3 subunit F